MKTAVTLPVEVLAAIRALPLYPASAITGRGNVRESFRWHLNDKLASALWSAIPSNHQYVCNYGGVSRYLSQEADRIQEMMRDAINLSEKASAEKSRQRRKSQHEKALKNARKAWLDASKIDAEIHKIYAPDQISEDGQTLILATRKGRVTVLVSLDEAKAVVAADSSDDFPYSIIRSYAFRAMKRTGCARSVIINEKAIATSSLTTEEKEEMVGLMAESSHPFTGRVLELKHKSGLSWSEIEAGH